MKRLAILACLLAAATTADARNITAIRFSGPGVVTASDGYRGPRVGSVNNIVGNVHFYLPGCLPDDIDGVVDPGNPLEGTGPCENVWDVRDQWGGSIDIFSQRTSAELTFDHGSLTGVYFRGERGPNYLVVDTDQFWGGWDDWTQFDYRYSGTWTLTDVRIAYDGGPLPGIPEPASWALMIAGFGLTGAMQRRRAGRMPTAPMQTSE